MEEGDVTEETEDDEDGIRSVTLDRKIIFRPGTELKFENYESEQHRPQFSGIKKEAIHSNTSSS